MSLRSFLILVLWVLLATEAPAFSAEVGVALGVSDLEIKAALNARTSADAHNIYESAQLARIAGAECKAEIAAERPGVSCLDYVASSSRLQGARATVHESRTDEVCADAARRSPPMARESLDRALDRAPRGSRCRQALLERRKDLLYMDPSLNPDEAVRSLVRDPRPSL